MASKSLRNKIAQKIAVAEQIIRNNSDRQAVESAKDEIMHLTVKYNLGLEDMVEIDDMVQKILKR